jgi:hypothetical protein
MANETPPAEVDPAVSDRPPLEEHKSTGKSAVRAKRGYEVVPSDKSLPVIPDDSDVNMSAAQADALMNEAGAYLVRTDSKE